MSENLLPPENFEFPFKPYKIQADFMRELYKVIEDKRIGIFESPTGTGKSLSLLCSVLKWQQDHEYIVKRELNDAIERLECEITLLDVETETENEWLLSMSNSIEKKRNLKEIKSKLDLINEFETKMLKLKEKKTELKKNRFNRDQFKANNNNLLEEEQKEEQNENDEYLIKNCDDEDEIEEDFIEENMREKFDGVKIYYCSRTHSQLKQILNEIKKTVYANRIRVVTLGSRQQYCINPSVKKLKSNVAINEKCLELQKSTSVPSSKSKDGETIKKTKTICNCPYFSQQKMKNFGENILSEIIDIEDLIILGEKEKICPYYSTRISFNDAQIILLPYQMLLHKNTRKQMGIKLINNIIIIDEAHNLLDAIISIHSATITIKQLILSHQQLTLYRDTYLNRFNSSNLLLLNQLIFIIYRFIQFLNKNKNLENRMSSTNELIFETEIISMNFFTILHFCDKTYLAEKVHNFSMNYKNVEKIESTTIKFLKKLEEEQIINKKSKTIITNELPNKCEVKQEEQKQQETISNVIRPVLGFIERLTEKSGDGRVLITFDTQKNENHTMKYILLNPNTHFKEILDESRAVIVAGGTMQPTSELKSQLFQSHIERVEEHFYGHVISKESVLPLVISNGPTGYKFLLNFANRSNPNLLNELQRTITNICNVVPEGIVCFFTSYDYLELFFNHLIKTEGIENLKKIKLVLRETRNCDENQLLTEYGKAASKQGGILFSVIGGKLSEGLNFSDHLGRCIIVVGLPYPNKSNPELQEKMKYLNKNISDKAGIEYYENLCMKAVNQSIGRSIRHINDYASVILLDDRYNQERIKKKLPTWISSHLQSFPTYGRVQAELGKFFSKKRI